MSRLRHRNLVPLLGCCHPKGQLLLVYDYMPNGSLDKYLYDQSKTTLNWNQRLSHKRSGFRICSGGRGTSPKAWIVVLSPSARPSMRQVVEYLEKLVQLPDLSQLRLSAIGLTFAQSQGFGDFVANVCTNQSTLVESIPSGGR